MNSEPQGTPAGAGPRAVFAGPPPKARLHPRIAGAAALSGALMGIFSIANTSIGWHLATGRWILAEGAVPRSDIFSLTCGGAPWVDHEWLFQVIAAALDAVGGPPALVLLRAAIAAALVLLLTHVGIRSGLAPPVALLLAAVCVAGARTRFFVRPELVTLLVVPICVWLYLSRHERPMSRSLMGIAAAMLVGANAHGGAVVVPFILAGLLAAETVQSAAAGADWRRTLLTGAAAVCVSAAAGLLNPYGWDLYAAPFRLAALIADPAVSNPEWFPPSVARVPGFFLALAASLLVMVLRGRELRRWALWLVASALALRYVRNLGLFFVLMPLAVAPALATWRALSQRVAGSPRRTELLAVIAVLVLASSVAIAPQPGLGFGYDPDFYPTAACDLLDREGLPSHQLYNDVRFGGYLIDRYWPQRLVFQDDRNEIHEPLLRRIWSIFQRSDVAAFTSLLERHRCDTALLRYHPPLRVQTPDGTTVGERGFSALWLRPDDWALIYWDDLAMVFVRRREAPPELLERLEYRIVRPDDIPHLMQRAAVNPGVRDLALRESLRALETSPSSRRAAELVAALGDDSASPLTAR